MSEVTTARGDDLLGAIGTPIGVVAVITAIPPLPWVAMPVLCACSVIAITLGAIGLHRSRKGRRTPALSMIAVVLGGIAGGSAVVWLGLWGIAQLFSECLDVSQCG